MADSAGAQAGDANSSEKAFGKFPDHFSQVASEYSAFRPEYPTALFDALRTEFERFAERGIKPLVWDCAAGTGQASLPLGDRFGRVLATDASSEQISRAAHHRHVHYATALAECCPLRSSSVSVVTVAQALHWFRFDPFFAEVKRVLAPDGLIACWAYGLLRVDANVHVERLVHEFSEQTVGAWWPPERAHIDDGYASIPFPFERIEVGPFHMSAVWSRAQFVGYLRTWSSVSRKKAATGTDSVVEFEAMLSDVWGPSDTLIMRWPLTIMLGRKV